MYIAYICHSYISNYEFNHCSGSDVYLASNGLQTLFFRGGFFGEVSSHVLNFEKKKECPIGTARSGIIVIVIGR